MDSRFGVQATGVAAILGLSKTVPEWLETSLASFDFTSQEKLVRRMRHSSRTLRDLARVFTDGGISLYGNNLNWRPLRQNPSRAFYTRCLYRVSSAGLF